MDVHIDSRFGLTEALEIGKGDVVSLVGAGGKTTALYGIAGELRRRGQTVITTTTTNLQTPRYPTTMPPLVCAADEHDWLATVRARVGRYGSATVVGTRQREDKLRGVEPGQIELLRDLADCVILEADGARGCSIKAPASHEPVIPDVTTLVVILAGMDALGMPLEEPIVHRLEIVSRLTGAAPGAPVTEEIIAQTLMRGYRDRIPDGSRFCYFLNKVDDSLLNPAETVGRLLVAGGAPEVIFGQARQPHDCFYRMTPRPAR